MTSVFHVITGLGLGGAETMLVQIAVALQKRGLPQHVISLTSSGAHAQELEKAGIPVTVLGLKSKRYFLQAGSKLIASLLREKPRIIQGWMYHGNLVAALAKCFAPKRTQLFWNIRASDMDETRYGRIIRWNARLSKWPDLIIVNSQVGRDFHASANIATQSMEIIHNGVDTKKFAPSSQLRQEVRAELGLSDDKVVAVVVARVDKMKDHPTFIAALKHASTVQGLLVGKDTELLDLPDNIMALGLRHDVSRLLAAADIIVSSSAFGEGFSNSIAEGMSAGLVPVVTNVGDSALIVGKTGYVVQPGDVSALGAALADVASMSAKDISRRGQFARKRILDEFKIETIVDRYEQHYRKLMN